MRHVVVAVVVLVRLLVLVLGHAPDFREGG
jgi:hypothetical protein